MPKVIPFSPTPETLSGAYDFLHASQRDELKHAFYGLNLAKLTGATALIELHEQFRETVLPHANPENTLIKTAFFGMLNHIISDDYPGRKFHQDVHNAIYASYAVAIDGSGQPIPAHTIVINNRIPTEARMRYLGDDVTTAPYKHTVDPMENIILFRGNEPHAKPPLEVGSTRFAIIARVV